MAEPTPITAQPATFSDWMRIQLRETLEKVAGGLAAVGFTPNGLTLLGFTGTVLGAVLLAGGWIQWGGVIILLSAPIDALDGALARKTARSSRFGAFLDSVTDRWSELFLFGGLAVHGVLTGDALAVLAAYAAAAGSLMVSYTKARAEGLGFTCNVGLLTRFERYLVLCPALLLGVPTLGTAIVAVFATFTALQRIWHVRTQPG